MIPTSCAITCIPNLCAFLKGFGEAVVGWGRKRSGGREREMVARKALLWLLLEDGFLRSAEWEDAPLSLVLKELGNYYDASAAYAFFITAWVPQLRHLKVLSSCEPIIDMPRSGTD